MMISDTPVLELGTFKLKAGTETDAFVDAANATADFLRSTGHVTARYLTQDETGLWSDVIVWSSHEAAQAAFEIAKTRSEFQAFFAPIDGASVEMRYPQILWQM